MAPAEQAVPEVQALVVDVVDAVGAHVLASRGSRGAR